MLMPPTWMTLSELGEFASGRGSVDRGARSIKKITPTLVREGDQVRVVLEPR